MALLKLLDTISTEEAVFDSILSFVPAQSPSEVLRTVANVSLALPLSHQWLAATSNQVLWRCLLFQHFDFTVHDHWNFDVFGSDELTSQPIADAVIRDAVCEWERIHGTKGPNTFLTEEFRCWTHLHVYFRPSQYGFLSRIQRGELAMNDWSSKEDPYTLFRDLVLLTTEFATLSPDLWTINDGSAPVYPCLLSQLTKPLGHRSFELATHCGIRPHYWALGLPLVCQWGEFGEEKKYSYVSAMPYDDWEACAAVETLVRENMTDWRGVCAFDFDLINRGAMFYVGPSKRSGRWIGFLGEGKL